MHAEVWTLVPEQDARVHDRIALDEIELYAEVIIAASASEGPLTQQELDKVLGIAPR